MALSIVTLNANGLRDQSKRAGLLQWFRSLTVVPDIVCLQECHCSSDLECQTWFRASSYLCALAAGSTHARGCIILFRPTLSLVQSWSEPEGRFLMCEFRFCNQVFRMKDVLYEVRCLKSNEDMILALTGQFKQLSHEPEKIR